LAPFAPLAGLKTKSSFPKHSKSLQNKAAVDERNPAPVLGLPHHHLITLTKLMIIIIDDQINDESHCIYQLGPPIALPQCCIHVFVCWDVFHHFANLNSHQLTHLTMVARLEMDNDISFSFARHQAPPKL